MPDLLQQRRVWNGSVVAFSQRSGNAAVTLLLLAAAVISALILGLLGGYFLGRTEMGPLQHRVKVLEEQVMAREAEVAALKQQVSQMTLVCTDGAKELVQVRDFLGRGEFRLAARLAEVALGQTAPPLCSEPKQAISGLWYEASIRSIIATPRPNWYDEALNQQVLADWLATERKADTYEVPKEKRWDALSIATVAANGGWWVWAEAASRQALLSGDIGPDAARFRYSVLRSYGHNLGFEGPRQKREQAVRLLATAQAMNNAWDLGKGEACEDLRKLGFTDCNQPSPDSSDPVLVAANK